MRNSFQSLEKKQITIEPIYLLKISNVVERISILYHKQQNQTANSFTGQFKQQLQNSFNVLGQSLHVWQNNRSMIQSAVLKSKIQLQSFCWAKLSQFVLYGINQELAKLIQQLHYLSQQHFEDYQKVLIEQRKYRMFETNAEKDSKINNLKKQITIQNQHIKDLQNRLKEVQDENSTLFSKMINNAKTTIDHTLNLTSVKPKNLYASKIKQNLNQSASKTLYMKQVQQTIFDIMDTKLRQQGFKGKKVSLNNFVCGYFRNKFGMKDLAQQAQHNFRQAVQFFAKTQQKNIFLLFISILRQECSQSYFQQSKIIYDKIAKCMKRYLNAKNGILIDELDRVYDSKLIDQKNDYYLSEGDIHLVLRNIYGSQQVDSLQSIFSEIMAQKIIDNQFQNQTVASKKIINQILNYELRKYLFNVEEIVRVIRDIDNESKGVFSYHDLEKIAIRLNLPEQKLGLILNSENQLQNRFLTLSEVIEIIEKVKKTKIKKKI